MVAAPTADFTALEPEPSGPAPSTLASVARRWQSEGPLVHEPTGIGKLDELTGGGPVYGSRWYLLGAPDAGKTALLVQVTHVWAAAGAVVGLLAIDEEDSDLATRFAQRFKFTRAECETRNPEVMQDLLQQLDALPNVFLYGPDWTIEDAAADLVKRADTKRAAIFVDSIQQARCAALVGAGDASERETVNANVRALRAVATQYGLITVATSEMNRNAYRSVESAERYNDMAAAKESGAIEYSARVMLALRSVKDLPDLIEVRVVKNKHGPSWPHEPPLYLALDRRRMMLGEADGPAAETPEDERRAKLAELDRQCLDVLPIIVASPGIGTVALRAKVAAKGLRCGKDVLGAILERLTETGRVEDRRKEHGTRTDHHYFPIAKEAT
jgi:KaiC/GvpD/RAD55 family RecA-like ATPase